MIILRCWASWCLCNLFHRRYHGIDENPGRDFISGVKDTSDNFSPVTATPAITDRWCRWHGWAAFRSCRWHKVAKISANFCKNSKMIPKGYSGARGNWFQRKTWKTNISFQTSFKNLKSKDDVSYFFFLWFFSDMERSADQGSPLQRIHSLKKQQVER